MKKLLVSGASYSANSGDMVYGGPSTNGKPIDHWATIIANKNNLEPLFTGVSWSDFESGVFLAAGRIMNDPDITHCIYTSTYTFVHHLQEENKKTREELIEIDGQIRAETNAHKDFLGKTRAIFNKFMPPLHNDPKKRLLGTTQWISHRPDQFEEGELNPTSKWGSEDIGVATKSDKPTDKEGRVFIGVVDEEFYQEPVYKRYLRFYTSLAFLKQICEQCNVKLLYVPIYLTDSSMNMSITQTQDWVESWDLVKEVFGSIPKWNKMYRERNWINTASHFDEEYHNIIADKFINDPFNKEWIKQKDEE
jgi:hypothetical protein|tara:strand:+ start:4924 stop:5844 length:921 start_codon:yes stop_codon:yes gene_type:complete